MSTSAENTRRVCAAKERHDRTCRYGGKAIEVHLTPHDIERYGWEDARCRL
jgi:hypothetical protein